MSVAAGSCAGFVLAGGHSSRMGRDKALLPVSGDVLIRRVASIVLEASGAVHLVGARESYGALHIPAISDHYPGFGPVGGIATALATTEAEWNLVVACDMPELSASFLDSLLSSARESGKQCTLPVTPDGRRHPLCAVYKHSAAPHMRMAVESGIHKLQIAIQGLSIHPYPVAQAHFLVNLNTPEEWKAYQNAAQ